MRIKYDPKIADIFDNFISTIANIRERNLINVEQTRREYEDTFWEARKALEADGQDTSPTSGYENVIFTPIESLKTPADLDIAMARDTMNKLVTALTAQQNAMFIYATGQFEQFAEDMIASAVKKSKSTRELYHKKFVDFANAHYNKYNDDSFQKELTSTTKILASYNQMAAAQGFIPIIHYLFDQDKILSSNEQFQNLSNLYKEIRERRNLLVHRKPYADKPYYEGIKRSRIKQWEKMLSSQVLKLFYFDEARFWIDTQWDRRFFYPATLNSSLKDYSMEDFEGGVPIPEHIIASQPKFNLNVNPAYLDQSLNTLILFGSMIFSTVFRASNTREDKYQKSFVTQALKNINNNYCLPLASEGMPHKYLSMNSTDPEPEFLKQFLWYEDISFDIIDFENNLNTTGKPLDPELLLMWLSNLSFQIYAESWEDETQAVELVEEILAVLSEQSTILCNIAYNRIDGDELAVDELIQHMSDQNVAVNLDLISPNEDQFWSGVNLDTLYTSPLFRFFRKNKNAQKFFQSPLDYWIEESKGLTETKDFNNVTEEKIKIYQDSEES